MSIERTVVVTEKTAIRLAPADPEATLSASISQDGTVVTLTSSSIAGQTRLVIGSGEVATLAALVDAVADDEGLVIPDPPVDEDPPTDDLPADPDES